MTRGPAHRERWAVILAGGEGRRLQQFTRSLTGDDRPKQFCRLLGQHTLLAETRHRVCLNVEAARTLYVLTRAHERFYQSELAEVAPDQLVEQPANLGTAAAVASALSRLARLGARGVVGLFPADHYYRNPDALRRSVDAAFAFAEANPDRVVLLGAEPEHAETEYGWIEPGLALDGGGSSPVRSVARFWEKPHADIADDLFKRGCLWNTFILVASVEALTQMMAQALSHVWSEFGLLRNAASLQEEYALMDRLYGGVAPSDFSHDVLTAQPARLAVVTLRDAGWTDLGQPGRVLRILAQDRGRSSIVATA